MTRDEAVAIIGDRLGQRTGLGTQIAAEMQLRQTVLEGRPELPWFLLTKLSYTATATAINSFAGPTDLLLEYDDPPGAIFVTDPDTLAVTRLIKVSFSELGDRRTEEPLVGRPRTYSWMGSDIECYPTTDKLYLFTGLYYQKAVALTTGTLDNAWLNNAPDILIAETGLKIAQFLRDQVYIQLFDNDRKEAWMQMLKTNTARVQAARAAYMGG